LRFSRPVDHSFWEGSGRDERKSDALFFLKKRFDRDREGPVRMFILSEAETSQRLMERAHRLADEFHVMVIGDRERRHAIGDRLGRRFVLREGGWGRGQCVQKQRGRGKRQGGTNHRRIPGLVGGTPLVTMISMRARVGGWAS